MVCTMHFLSTILPEFAMVGIIKIQGPIEQKKISTKLEERFFAKGVVSDTCLLGKDNLDATPNLSILSMSTPPSIFNIAQFIVQIKIAMIHIRLNFSTGMNTKL